MKRSVVKKAFISIISLLLIFTLAACTKTEKSSKESKDGDGVSFEYMMAGKYINWLNDLKWYPELLKKTNADITLVEGGKDDDSYYKNLDLKIGSGEFPDAGIVKLSQAEVYGKQGAFLDLAPFIKDHAPNLQKYIDDNPEYKKLLTTKDGEIFGIPQGYPKITYVTFYRADLLNKAGITELPRTMEEFTNMLRALKENNKDVENFYPFTGRDGYIKFTEAYGANDKIDENETVHGIYKNGLGYDIQSPGFKKLIEQYITWYNEGLVDPEWVTGVATEESWQTKMLQGKGAIGNDFFTRPSWFMNNGGPTNDPNYDIQVMNPLLDENGEQTKLASYEPQYRLDRVLAINSGSDDKAEGIIKFIDYAFSEEGRNLMNYGVEGQSYEEKDGQKEFTVEFETEGNQPIGTPVWNFLQDRLTFPAPVNNAAYYQWMDPLTKSYATTFFDEFAKNFPSLKYSTEQLEERSKLLARVEPEVNANLVKFITGKRSMSEWDAFVTDMDKIGYSDVVAIDQEAYDANK